MIRFRCKECGKKLKAEEEIVGRKVKCTSCENVETVPPEDNLTRPNLPKKAATRLAINKPNPVAHSSSSKFSDSSLSDSSLSDSSEIDESDIGSLLGDDSGPVEMFGHSGAGPSAVETGRPRFKQLARTKSDFRRFVPIALIGLAIVGIVLVAINSGWIFNSGPKFDPEFEALPAVANYRRAQKQLDKSRRVMMVVGEARMSKSSLSQELIDELNDYNESILALTKNTTTLVEASRLVEQGEEAQANKMLTDEANIMDDRKFDVDRKTEDYNELTY